jgi:hypothetical protein
MSEIHVEKEVRVQAHPKKEKQSDTIPKKEKQHQPDTKPKKETPCTYENPESDFALVANFDPLAIEGNNKVQIGKIT